MTGSSRAGHPGSLSIYLPDFVGGGVPQLYLGLAPHFRDAGFEVTFLLDRRKGEMLDRVPAGIPVVSLDADRQVRALPRLIHYLSDARPQILLSAIEHMNVMASLACRIAGHQTLHVLTQHNPLSVQAKRPGLKFRALPLLYRWSLPHSAANIAVSCGVADDIAYHANFPRERIAVIYNGVATSDIAASATGPLPSFWPREATTLVTVGRLAAQKDQGTLLRALSLLPPRHTPHLIILGEGPLRPELEALARQLSISERVHMPGFVANPHPVVKAADLFVLSSRYEGFALVLCEALTCGTSVVSTNCPFGPSEILEDGQHGHLVPVEDSQALANAIAEALDNPRPRNSNISRGSNFSIERCAQDYIDLLINLVRGKAQSSYGTRHPLGDSAVASNRRTS